MIKLYKNKIDYQNKEGIAKGTALKRINQMLES
jgi:hypothetical protein